MTDPSTRVLDVAHSNIAEKICSSPAAFLVWKQFDFQGACTQERFITQG